MVTLVTAVDSNGYRTGFPGAARPRSAILPGPECVPSASVTSPDPPRGPREGTSTGRRAPAILVVAVVLVGLEAVGLVLLAAAELGSLSATKATMGVTTSLFFIGYGVGLGACAWALRRLRSWARAPVVMAQLIQLGVAWSFRGGTTTAVSAALAVAAALVLLGIFHPASIAAFAATDAEPDGGTEGRTG